MAAKQEGTDFSRFYDELFNHMLCVNIYTPLCMFFSLPATYNKTTIISTLKDGIGRLSAEFVWLTGQVIGGLSADGKPQPLRIVPSNSICRFSVVDCTQDDKVPSMKNFQDAGFPCHLIDGETFTSLVGVPNSRTGDQSPVFFAQATFIRDGLVLSFAGEHSTMDGHGTGQVIRLLDKACHGEPFTAQEVYEGNRARGITVPLLDTSTYVTGPELDYLVRKPVTETEKTNVEAPAECTWAYVYFSSQNLSTLKKLVSPYSASPSSLATESSISTNDALTAFIWKAVARVRASRLEADTPSTIGRAVDVRSALSFSPSYLGNMSNHTYSTLKISSLVTSSLGTIASTLRSALEPASIAYGIRSLATHYALSEDKSTIHYGANMDFSRDLFISSWARLSCYQHDFSLGVGTPRAVRRPGFLPIEGLIYILPMDNTGGVEAMISLRNEDLEKLKTDAEFGAYSKWTG